MYCVLQVLQSVDQNIKSQETFIADATTEFFVYKRRKLDSLGGDGGSLAELMHRDFAIYTKDTALKGSCIVKFVNSFLVRTGLYSMCKIRGTLYLSKKPCKIINA